MLPRVCDVYRVCINIAGCENKHVRQLAVNACGGVGKANATNFHLLGVIDSDVEAVFRLVTWPLILLILSEVETAPL
jgi:hypothetical protein